MKRRRLLEDWNGFYISDQKLRFYLTYLTHPQETGVRHRVKHGDWVWIAPQYDTGSIFPDRYLVYDRDDTSDTAFLAVAQKKVPRAIAEARCSA